MARASKKKRTTATDYDSPWKEALELYLPECLALLAPWLYEQIDWSYPPVFLDKELQALAPNSANGRRYADKLVRLRNKRGQSIWILLHVEVQGGKTTLRLLEVFATRMFKYHTRIHDHYNTDLESPEASNIALISLGILTHSQGSTDHLIYQHTDLLGSTQMHFKFPVVHLRNWLPRWAELEAAAETNPFAVIIMAQLIAQEVPQDSPERPIQKSNMVRWLYRYNYSQKDIRQVLRLMGWMINLSEEQLPVFFQHVTAIEQEYHMSYVTNFERLLEKRGIQKGIEKGMEKGIAQGLTTGQRTGQASLLQGMLTRKFGPLSDANQQRLKNAEPGQLEIWSLNLMDAETLDDVFSD